MLCVCVVVGVYCVFAEFCCEVFVWFECCLRGVLYPVCCVYLWVALGVCLCVCVVPRRMSSLCLCVSCDCAFTTSLCLGMYGAAFVRLLCVEYVSFVCT